MQQNIQPNNAQKAKYKKSNNCLLINNKNMSHIKPQLLQQTIPLYSIRLIEAHRVFDLIQQNIPEPKTVLTTRSIETFLDKFGYPDPQQKALKLMQEINRQGVEMTADRFAASLAKYLKNVQLTNQQSLNELYKSMKGVLSLTYQNPCQPYQKWDIQSMLTTQTLIQRQNSITIFYNQLQPYIDAMELFTFQNNLEKVNYCLSVISIANNETEVFNVYRTFIIPNVMQHISSFLATISSFQADPSSQLYRNIMSQRDTVASYFGVISHLYSACRYRQLKEKLQTLPLLFYHQTFKTITTSMTIPQPKIQKQVAICLSVLSRYLTPFNDWLLADIQGHFLPLLNSIGVLKDQIALYYSLICLKNVIKRYQQKSDIFKTDQKNQETLERIQVFSIYLIKTYAHMELQKECFLLVAEILKVCPITYKQIDELKVTTKVFEIQIDYQAVLVPATLVILQVSIHKKLDDLTNMIINDPAFLTCLQTHLGVKQSAFFYQFLHIVYLLSYTHTNFLLEKEILNRIVTMMYEQVNPTVASIASDIIFNTVQQGLENEQILEALYEKLLIFDRIMPILFKKCFEKSQYLNEFMRTETQNIQPAYSYFDNYILLNFFKILYSLAVGVSRRHKKFAFSRRFNMDIINSVVKILQDLFKSGNPPLIEVVLRQKIRITNSKKIKLENGIPLYKAVTIILDEMTYNAENKPIQILRIIDNEIKSFGENLIKSDVFTLHQLEVENIPLYIKIDIEFDNRRWVRSIPHKFELSSLKTYLKTFVVMESDMKPTDVKDVVLRYKPNNRIIENEVQYRSIVNKALENKVTQFEWLVVDIKWKNRREDVVVSSFMIPNMQPGMRSYRDSNVFASRVTTTSRPVPNMGVSRYTTLRENPGNDARRSYYSPINFNYTYENRGASPVFGGSGGNRNR